MVLDGIHLLMSSGECVAVKGRNGTGKSTLLRIAAGIERPSSGRMELGISMRQVGYVPDRFPYLRFTLNEYLMYMGRIRGIDRDKLRLRIRELVSFAGLPADADRLIRYYSKGMLQKAAILQALIEQPQLLLMDEPMSGLDQTAREDILLFLGRLRSQGMAILFSSHEDHWVAQLADRTFELEDGLLRLQAADELHKPSAPRMLIEVEKMTEATLARLRDEAPPTLAAAIRETSSTLTGIRIQADSARTDELLIALIQSGGSVRSVKELIPAFQSGQDGEEAK